MIFIQTGALEVTITLSSAWGVENAIGVCGDHQEVTGA